jgi:hypothetical protein
MPRTTPASSACLGERNFNNRRDRFSFQVETRLHLGQMDRKRAIHLCIFCIDQGFNRALAIGILQRTNAARALLGRIHNSERISPLSNNGTSTASITMAGCSDIRPARFHRC